MKKYYYEVPLLNFEGAPGIPFLNFKEGPGVQLLNFRGSQVPLLNFEGGPGFKVPGSWSHFYTMTKTLSLSLWSQKL